MRCLFPVTSPLAHLTVPGATGAATRRSLLGLLPLLGLALLPPVQAGPAVCTTTLEAPPRSSSIAAPAAPVEVTRCGVTQTVPELMQRRFFSYTAPFAEGVSITGQVTSLLGISMGGGDGRRVMGLGFPDQTIIWDGTAVQNTTQFLLQQQSDPMPWRTTDVSSGFSGSLGGGQAGAGQDGPGQGAAASGIHSSWQDGRASFPLPVQDFR